MSEKGVLYLVPCDLGGDNVKKIMPEQVLDVLNVTKYYIVENIRTARRYISKMKIEQKIDDLDFSVLNKHTQPEELAGFLAPALQGENIGLISEAGVPGVADPGADVVAIAHSMGIRVVPLVGPSSILLSLMASGLNGQNFAFLGYIPAKNPDRSKQLKQMEQRSESLNQTQIFIETPFRNMHLFDDVLKSCSDSTMFCVARGITTDQEFIKTLSIKDWKKQKDIDLNKIPTIFLIKKG
ncbi:MAG: SAM-dependent methyltransferase [Bacteroidales bacterium]|nr:SAM-dependent methyltransferase [Bacteroidales bacterium]